MPGRPRRATPDPSAHPRAYAVPAVALGLSASLVLALAGCGQPAPSSPDDSVAPTVSVAVQPTITAETPSDDVPDPVDTTDPGDGGLFDAASSLTGATCAPSGESWSFTGTLTNSDTQAHTFTVAVFIVKTSDASDVAGKEVDVDARRRGDRTGLHQGLPHRTEQGRRVPERRHREGPLTCGSTSCGTARPTPTSPVSSTPPSPVSTSPTRGGHRLGLSPSVSAVRTSARSTPPTSCAPSRPRRRSPRCSVSRWSCLPGLREIQAGDYEMSTEWQPYIDAVIRWRDEPGPHDPRR